MCLGAHSMDTVVNIDIVSSVSVQNVDVLLHPLVGSTLPDPYEKGRV